MVENAINNFPPISAPRYPQIDPIRILCILRPTYSDDAQESFARQVTLPPQFADLLQYFQHLHSWNNHSCALFLESYYHSAHQATDAKNTVAAPYLRHVLERRVSDLRSTVADPVPQKSEKNLK